MISYVIKGTSKWARKRQRHTVAWRAGSGGLVCGLEPPIIAPPISRQIGLTRKSVRVIGIFYMRSTMKTYRKVGIHPGQFTEIKGNNYIHALQH